MIPALLLRLCSLYLPVLALLGLPLAAAFRAQEASASDSGDEVPRLEIQWVDHNSIEPLAGRASAEQLRFLPIFVFTHKTCLPAPAIDPEGRLGAGLKAKGRMDGDCLGYDRANIYTQSLTLGKQSVHLYALYYPKDGSAPNSSGGHRHDWENVMVWTDQDQVTSITFGQHGGWYTMPARHIRFQDGRPLVFVGKAKHGMYHSPNNGPGGIAEGLCYFCDTRSFPGLPWLAPHRLVAYEEMSDLQREILALDLWGNANSPFKLDGFAQRSRSVAAGEVCHDRGCKCDANSGDCPGFP